VDPFLREEEEGRKEIAKQISAPIFEREKEKNGKRNIIRVRFSLKRRHTHA
jgi:hypothetical protein